VSASYWTLGKIQRYMRNTVGPAALPAAMQAQLAKWPTLLKNKCPSWLEWPETFGAALDREAVSNFNNATGQNNEAIGGARKGRDINLNGRYLAGSDGAPGAFDMLFDAAGGWSWTVQYSQSDSGVKNTLKTVPNRYTNDREGVTIPFAAGGPAATALKGAVITQLRYKENSENTATAAFTMGALVKIETRCSTKGSDHSGGIAGLVEAWTPERFTLWLEYILTHGDNDEAFYEANQRYPEVLTTWQLNPNFNFQADTGFSGYPRAQITRPVWPFLLSFQSGSNGPIDSNSVPYPIQVEVSPRSGSSWKVSIEQSGLKVLDNGHIYMPSLRDVALQESAAQPGSWRLTSGTWREDGFGNLDNNDIRLTLAIRCDHRLSHAVAIAAYDAATVAGQTSPYSDVVETTPDLDKFKPGYDKTLIMDLGTLYELWVRLESYPEPQSAGGSKFPDYKFSADGLSPALRNDTALQLSHSRRALRDRFRLARDGFFQFDGSFVLKYPIGTPIKELKPVGVSGRKSFFPRSVVRRLRLASEKKFDKTQNVESIANYTQAVPG